MRWERCTFSGGNSRREERERTSSAGCILVGSCAMRPALDCSEDAAISQRELLSLFLLVSRRKFKEGHSRQILCCAVDSPDANM